MQNYYEIKPIKAFVDSKQILKEETDKPLACEIIALSIYKDEVITATIMLDNGAIFSYIPFSSLSINEQSSFKYNIQECHFVNAPDYEIAITYFKSLDDLYFKNFEKDEWFEGHYILTIDFIKENELVNLIVDEDGDFLLRPFHKLIFGKTKEDVENIDFSIFKKQRNTYTI